MRLFIALGLQARAERAVYSLVERLQLMQVDKLSWVPPQSWHITLAFIGQCSGTAVASLGEAMDRAASAVPALHLQLDQLTWFPSVGKPRMLVLEPALNQDLLALRSELATQLCDRGFTLEQRAFRPHLTLARYRGARRSFNPPHLPEVNPLGMTVENLTLYESVLSDRAPDYQPLHDSFLRSAA